MDNDENIKESSAFNEGMLQIQRLHNSWMRCNHFSSKGLLKDWRWELDVIWRELSYDASKAEKDFKTEFKELDVKINVAATKNLGAELYSCLVEKEVLLRELQHAAGKGGKYLDGDEDDIED